MKSSMKRLAKDQIAVRKALPPNYFFADENDNASLPDDLTQLVILLAGPEGTPYSEGLWRLRLDIPIEYPQSPPTATFQTRIFHPNVAEETGAVCLETLKRDWDPKLTLKDILITISCLLIQPNPDSALNEKAGVLVRDDYNLFAKQARLMTKIHAPTPSHLTELAQTARRRGEESSEGPSSTIVKEVNLNHDTTSKPIAKENVPSKANETVRDRDGKKLKRSLDNTSPLSEQSQGQEETIESRLRRKSPKYSHHSDHSQATTVGQQGGEVENNSFTSHLEKDDITPSTKVIFRARWAAASGKIHVKARIGIRRL